MKKVLFPILALVLALGLAVPAAPAVAHVEGDPFTTDLLAGQDIDVGTVSVWNDGTNLYVTYEITEPDWVITGTHLYVGKTDPNTLTTAPGQFPYDDADAASISDTVVAYEIPLTGIYSYKMQTNKKGKETGVMVAYGTPGVTPCDDVYIAAHAEVQKVTVITPAPYYASTVDSYSQGLRKDGTPVVGARSVPEQGLVYESAKSESSFFSLGFGGWIIVEFNCPIRNGEGNDVQVIEDTWGSYPLEKADVYGSQDNVDWKYLGEADNTYKPDGVHTISEFDLDGILDWAKYIKVKDTTDPAVHRSNADGYDLNAVVSLQDCIEIEEETAWGSGTDFEHPNWATYFTYTVQGCRLVNTVQVPSDSTSVSSIFLEDGKTYSFKASGTFAYNNASDWADAEWYLKGGEIVKGDTEGSKPYVLDISVDGYSINRDWGDYNPEHIYYMDWAGTDASVSFSIYDSAYGDNSGSLTVEIYECCG